MPVAKAFRHLKARAALRLGFGGLSVELSGAVEADCISPGGDGDRPGSVLLPSIPRVSGDSGFGDGTTKAGN